MQYKVQKLDTESDAIVDYGKYLSMQDVNLIIRGYRFHMSVGCVESRRKIIDSFDVSYCTRDEAIDLFLDYFRKKNYKIIFENK